MRPGPRRGPSRAAVAALGLGLGLALVAGRLAPLPGPPLYDGVFQAEPYRWLQPPGPGHAGNPTSASETINVAGGESPLVSVATGETPPQVSIFAAPGTLILPPGTTTITVSIQAIVPSGQPPDGRIDGNVYRLAIVNQAGRPVTAKADGQVTVVLEGPDPTVTTDTIERFDGKAWQALTTQPGDFPATFFAIVTDFGDFALVRPGPEGSAGASGAPAASPGGSAPASPTETPSPSGEGTQPGASAVSLYAGIAVAVLLLGLLLLAVFPRRRRPRRSRANRPPPRTRR